MYRWVIGYHSLLESSIMYRWMIGSPQPTARQAAGLCIAGCNTSWLSSPYTSLPFSDTGTSLGFSVRAIVARTPQNGAQMTQVGTTFLSGWWHFWPSSTSLIPCEKIGLPFMGKPTAALGAALSSPPSECNALFRSTVIDWFIFYV